LRAGRDPNQEPWRQAFWREGALVGRRARAEGLIAHTKPNQDSVSSRVPRHSDDKGSTVKAAQMADHENPALNFDVDVARTRFSVIYTGAVSDASTKWVTAIRYCLGRFQGLTMEHRVAGVAMRSFGAGEFNASRRDNLANRCIKPCQQSGARDRTKFRPRATAE
jgi:hypothetical protein